MISETKADDSFPIVNSVIDGYSTPCRLNRSYNGGRILIYTGEDIPTYLITTEKEPVENFYQELNLRNGNCLINCSYNLQKTIISNHLIKLEKLLDLHSSRYEKVLVLGSFNAGVNGTKYSRMDQEKFVEDRL